MDKLEEIFKMQYELNKRIGVDTAAMGDAVARAVEEA